jgi:ATP-binding protein involved in chromosome partitioning
LTLAHPAPYVAAMAVDAAFVREVLGRTPVPGLGSTVGNSELVKDVRALDGIVQVTLAGPDPGGPTRQALGRAVRDAVGTLEGVTGVEVRWADEVSARTPGPEDPMPAVRNVVLVMSGKGGVGKSTVATNLTLALARMGYRVGLLDADIYGPSIPTMLGVSGRPVSLDGKSIEPLSRFGIKLMSIGFLLEDPHAAVIWRGPMLHGALQQFMKDVNWGELDYVVMDLPPGTGDVALTLSQRVKATGAVVVTTPQAVATDDVYKSVSMCQKVNIPILGVVENMSYFLDSAGVRHELFGKGGGQAIAEFAGAPLLGQLPIEQVVREWGDRGTPVVQALPHSPMARNFYEVAERLGDRIAQMRSEEQSEGDGVPVIDRSGGTAKRRLPVAKA